MSSEQTIQNNKPLTAQEMAEAECLALERRHRGDKRAMEEFTLKMPDFVKTASLEELNTFLAIACKDAPEAQMDFLQKQSHYSNQAHELIRNGRGSAWNISPHPVDAHGFVHKSVNETPETNPVHANQVKNNPTVGNESLHTKETSSVPEWNTAKFETKGMANDREVSVLDPEVYTALKAYEANPERIARIVSASDLQTLHEQKQQERKELEGQKIPIINSGNYPHGWDSAVNTLEEKFQKREAQLLGKDNLKVQEFLDSLATDRWQNLMMNTEIAMYESEVKGSIRKGLGIVEPTSTEMGTKESTQENVANDAKAPVTSSTEAHAEHTDERTVNTDHQSKQTAEVTGERMTNDIYEKTTNLVKKISALSVSINRDIQAVQEQFTTVLQSWGGQEEYQQAIASVPMRYEHVIKGEIQKYAHDIGDYLVGLDPLPQVVVQKQCFQLPVGGNNVTLDFSGLGDVNTGNKQELSSAFQKNFDSIYRDTIPEKAFDSLKSGYRYAKDHPAEVGVDVGSVVISGIVTALMVDVSSGAGIPKAGLVFTGVNNLVSGIGYGAIGANRGQDSIKSGLAGISIQDTDTAGDIVRKKGFELASNTALFGTFKGTAIAEKAFKDSVSKLANTTMTPELAQSIAKNPIFQGIDTIGTPTLKTATEATFFTYYIALSGGADKALQAMVQSGATKEEAMGIVGGEIDKVQNMDTFLDYYMYNLGFIIAVKGGTKIGEAGLSKMDESKFTTLDTALNTEQRKLEEKGYSFANHPGGGFFVFDPYGHKADMSNPDLTVFVNVNKDLFKLSIHMNPMVQKNTNQNVADQNIATPDSGRGGKTATNPTNLEAKFIKLANNAVDAQKGGVSYALKDETVFSEVEKTGFSSDGSGVKDGLMKKSGFEEFEIRDYKDGKLKGNNEVEKEAFEEMEVAVEKIMMEYHWVQTELLKLSSSESKSEILGKYEPIVQERMLRLWKL